MKLFHELPNMFSDYARILYSVQSDFFVVKPLRRCVFIPLDLLTKLCRKCQERILLLVYPDDVPQRNGNFFRIARTNQTDFQQGKENGMAYGDKKVN